MPLICLISALPSEARPLIEHFNLQTVTHSNLKLHKGDIGYLLQCGVGKLNAATATATVLTAFENISAIINVGITGSGRALGEIIIAHQIKDAASGQQWFPHLPPVRKLPNTSSVSVVTVDTPATDYNESTAFDMEASGIFAAASKTLDLAFIHSIKVVSDNDESSIENISAASVSESIQHSIPVIEQLVAALPFNVQASNTAEEVLVKTLCNRLHYTETERHALRQLVARHNALLGCTPNPEQLEKLATAKAIRKELEYKLSNAAIAY